jgi:hypothetical protein
MPRRRFCGAGLAALLLLAGCSANGDFGRIREPLVTGGIHDWLGAEAASASHAPVSAFRLTDDERLLRDLAYPLIEPPYDRQRWYSILNEYGLTRSFRRDWRHFDRAAYYRHLQDEWFRSPSGQYGKLNEDIRNDVVRMDPFFLIAVRVADLDRKRYQSLAYVSELTPAERDNTLARIGENNLIVSWVVQSLGDRAASYRYALERMVIAVPSPLAVEPDRSLALLQQKIAAYQRPFPPAPTTAPKIARAGAKRHVSK